MVSSPVLAPQAGQAAQPPERALARQLVLRGLAALYGRRGYDRQDVGAVRRVLVIRPDHLGDLLLATPALGLLRAALPDAEITALVGPWARPVLDGRGEVDVVRECAFPGFTR